MTAICGAAKNRVFIRYELPALVKNPHIKIYNQINKDATRRMFKEVSPAEGFNFSCLSELQMSYHYAQTQKTNSLNAWNDYFERVSFYETEQKTTRGKKPTLTREKKRQRQKIISDYKLEVMYAAPPSRWKKPENITLYSTYKHHPQTPTLARSLSQKSRRDHSLRF